MKFKRWSQDIYIAVILLAAGIFLLTNAMFIMGSEAAQFPILILIVFVTLSAALLIKGIRDTKNADSGEESLKKQLKFAEVRLPLLAFVFITIYVVLVDKVGFIVPSLIFTAGMMWFNYARNKVACILVPCGLVGFLYVLFTYVLSSRLP